MITLVALTLLIFNLFNEVLLMRYNSLSSDVRFQRLWHFYDAAARVTVLSIIIIASKGITIKSLLLFLSLLLIYHVLFDVLFNIGAAYKRERLSFSRVFHLGNNLLDRIIRNIGLLFTKIKSFNKPITVPIVNCLIKLIELLIGGWLWKTSV